MTDSAPDTEPAPSDSAATPAAGPVSAVERSGVSRRGLLGMVGAGAAGLAVGAGAGIAGTVAVTQASAATGGAASVHPFYGEHQSGITTEVQDHLHFAAYDMMARTTREDLIALLKDWSYAASRMTQGLDVSATGAVGGSVEAPPDDTGEALGLAANSLTITIGFGPTLFESDTGDRFGLAAQRPPELQRLPAFLGDALDLDHSGGDLCIQACADDPQVAVHAIRNLSRIAFGRAKIRWSQLGFGRTSKTTVDQSTPRNLFGFKDGTANILATDADALRDDVWVAASDQPSWMAGGSYLVARKIAMIIESWDRVRLAEQQHIIGRDKAQGAPLSGGDEFTAPDFQATDASGAPAIAPTSHVRLAHPDLNGGVRILRRGYNFVDGNTDLGRLSAGLFFLSFQRSPEQFVTLQRSLSKDAMNEYIRHVGSGIWAIPPGAAEGSYVGAGLFG
ncbi:iron uptake transporter deferrochelatase/peroxidase subunit [Microbacterium sp. CJ88]|uniref:iron uptake transporter deferrochelatase/peroxidase subunit n=1 Tax=Microbacterium sp. CJ88 TaxID=3445672 RepID=UPI003F65BDFB